MLFGAPQNKIKITKAEDFLLEDSDADDYDSEKDYWKEDCEDSEEDIDYYMEDDDDEQEQEDSDSEYGEEESEYEDSDDDVLNNMSSLSSKTAQRYAGILANKIDENKRLSKEIS